MKVLATTRLAVLSIALLLLSASYGLACTCVPERPPCEAFGSARAVFIGKVVGSRERRTQKNEDGTITTYDVGEIYFRVDESFGGIQGSRVVIHSGTGGGDCGYWFIRAKRYLVYAYGDASNWSTGICTRTRPLTEAAEDLTFLRNLPRKGTGARIYGTVVAALKDPKSSDWRTE